jgi:YD repeat-containing protein
MKKSLLLFSMITLICVVDCAAQSMIKVRLTDNSPLNVAVDGRYFNKRGTSVTVGDLPPGKHFVQIYNMPPGRMRQEIVYEGKIRTATGVITTLEYDTYNRRTSIQNQDIGTYMNARQTPGENSGLSSNQDDQYSGNNNSSGSTAEPAVEGSMTEVRIDQLKTTVDSKKTDTEKMTILKGELKNEQLTTAQVGMMMDWLGFDISKLQFAEWAWDITKDQAAYNSLGAKFKFKNYEDDFNKFLAGK